MFLNIFPYVNTQILNARVTELRSNEYFISLQWDKVAKYISIWSLFDKEKHVINSFTAVLKGSNFMDQRLKGWVSWDTFNTVLGLRWVCWSIHRIPQWLRLTGTSASYPVYPPCSTRTTSSQLFKTLSRQLSSIFKDGDSMVSLGNLCQGSITFTGKRCFLMFKGREPFVFSVSAHWFRHWASLERACVCLLCTLPSDIYIYW